MTPHPCDLPACSLPVRVRPFPLETVGSYVRRLAAANQVPFTELLDHLADDQTPARSPLVASRELGLNQPAVERLAAMSGTAATRLRQALPALGSGRPGSRPTRNWYDIGPVNRPVRACARCAALRSGGEILFYQPLHRTLCLRHGHWLAGRDDNREIDLGRLPEVMEAARRHIRLTRHRDPIALKSAYRQANQIAQDWFDRTSFPHQRLAPALRPDRRRPPLRRPRDHLPRDRRPHQPPVLPQLDQHAPPRRLLHRHPRVPAGSRTPHRASLSRQAKERPFEALGVQPVGRETHPRAAAHRLVTAIGSPGPGLRQAKSGPVRLVPNVRPGIGIIIE